MLAVERRKQILEQVHKLSASEGLNLSPSKRRP